MNPRSKKWTEADEAIIRKLVAEGKTCMDAGPILGRHPETCRSKAEAMGLKFAPRRQARAVRDMVIPTPRFKAPPPPRYSNFTQFVMGDPPIGRSALDQKRGQA